MVSWRPPGSILEAPDSILEAPKLDLERFWHEFFERDSWPECEESQERQERLPSQDLDHKCAKSGWAAVLPPRGGFNELEPS